MISMIVSGCISLILSKYQRTISPANQNIINKLSIFCINSATIITWCQGAPVLWRIGIAPLNVTAAIFLRFLVRIFSFNKKQFQVNLHLFCHDALVDS